jgi:fucose permease
MPHYCWSARLLAAPRFLIASFLADHIGIHHALILPVLCSVYIIFYALKSASSRRQQPT